MTRVVRFHETGGPEVLRIEDEALRAPGRGEVKLGLRAIGLNRAEVMFRRGQYMEQPRFPSRIGYEGSGMVEAAGEGVEGFARGDVVSLIPGFPMGEYGIYGEEAIVPAKAVVRHPASLSWTEAAAVWMQYLTAYGALIDIAGLHAGDTVVIPAASSSVGLAAIGLARMVGAVPVATTRTGAKREALRAAGAAEVIATAEEDLPARLREITGGTGARVIFDPVGGRGVEKLAEGAAEGAILFQYGALSSEPTPFPLFPALMKRLTMRGYTLHEITADPARLDRAVRFVTEGLESGALKPVISRLFPLDRIVEAHRFMESNEQIGKIVVTVE